MMRIRRFINAVACCCALFVAAPSARGQGLVQTTERLNLRQCPTCPPIKTLEAGQDLQVIGADGDWLNVRETPAGETGWVSSKYVTVPTELIDQQQERRLLHQRAVQTFFWLGFAGLVASVSALLGRSRRRQGRLLFALLFDPRILISWFILLESGVCGLILVTSSLFNWVPAQNFFEISAWSGYSGWAFFWAIPAFWRLGRKVAFWLITWFSPSIFALFFLIPTAAFVYSLCGGGIFQFVSYCWKMGRPAAEKAPTGGEPKEMSKAEQTPAQERGKPMGNPWQLEHPEW